MKTTNMLTKKSLFILAALLGLQFNTLVAAANSGVHSDGAPTTEAIVINLAPVTPREADFEDIPGTLMITNGDLAPTTPATADFEEQL